MNWSALTKKQKQMVFVTIILAIAQIFILIHFLTGRNAPESGSLSPKEELAELQDKIENAYLMINKSQDNRRALKETIQKLRALNVYMPSASDRYQWVKEYILPCAEEAGVKLEAIIPVVDLSSDKNANKADAYEVRLETQCGYNQLVKLLWYIEQGNQLVRVKSVDVTSLPATPYQHKIQVILQWPASLVIEQGGL
jgi:hypothetical protein